MGFFTDVIQRNKQNASTIDFGVVKQQPGLQSVEPYSPVQSLDDIASALGSAREFLLPTRREIFERKQEEAKQSLLPTDALKRDIKREQAAFAPDYDTDTFADFLDKPTIDFPDFAGITRRISTKVIERIAKETTEEGVQKQLNALNLKLTNETLSELRGVLASETDPNQIQKIIDFAVKRDAPLQSNITLPDGEGELSAAELSRAARNSLENNQSGIRPDSIEAQRAAIKEKGNDRTIEVRQLEDGSLDIVDGRHNLQAALDEGLDTIKVRNVTDTGGTIERKFITSAKKILPDAPKIAGVYVPRSTDELAIKAKNFITEDAVAAERMALTGTDETAVAVASELLKKYADDAAKTTDEAIRGAIYDKAAEIANTIAPKLTELGRAVQAASILGRLTPEGQVRFAAKEIQRYNQTATKKIPELTGEQAKYITEEMKAIDALPVGDEKAIRFDKLQKYISDLVPSPLLKKITTIWKAGLLTGLKTTGLNVFSTLSHSLSEIAKDLPASIVDSAASLFTGERTKTLTLRKAFDGIKEGSVKGKRYFLTGFDERNIGAKLDYKRVNFGKGKVAKAFRIYTETVFRTLGAQDQVFYYAAMSRSLMDQALAKGKNLGLRGAELRDYAYQLVEEPTEEMMEYGVIDATTAVFQNETALGKIASGFQNVPVVGQFILPFARTPSSVAMQIIAYSPVGIAKTIVENIGKGKFDQRLFSQGIGRGLTGTAVIYIGMKLAEEGLVTLDYPVGDEREQELQKAEGVKNNSIKVDGKWRSPIVLGPAGNLLLIGAHFQLAAEKAGSPSEAFTNAALGSAKSFLEQTFVTGLQNFVEALTDLKNEGPKYISTLVASAVPTIVSDVARATDPLERRAETTLERVQARVPGLRDELEPQVDILGRERESVGNPLEILLDPTRPSPDTNTAVTLELRRLMDEGHRVSPTMLGDRKGFDALTQEQNTELWKKSGEILNHKLSALFLLDQYQNLPDDKKAKLVEDFVEKSKNSARAGMVLELTNDMQGAELRETLSKLKEGGLLTRDVFRLYQELR